MPFAAHRITILFFDQLSSRKWPSPCNVRGDALGDGDDFTVDYQDAVIAPRDEPLDYYIARIIRSPLESLAHLFVAVKVYGDAFAVISVQRLDDDREAKLSAISSAASSVSTTRPLGTGMPASSSIRLVSSLSQAMSVAIRLVIEVTVASIRF